MSTTPAPERSTARSLTWIEHQDSTSWIKKNTLGLAVASAFVIGLGLAITGGLMGVGHLHSIPQIAAHKVAIGAALGGLGGLLFLGSVGFAVFRKTRNTDPAPREQIEYKIVTWNVGDFISDAPMLRERRRLMNEGQEFQQAHQAALKARQNRELNELDGGARKERVADLGHTLTQMGSTDIICLQEVRTYTDKEIRTMLPNGYDYARREDGEQDCLVAWNTQRFGCTFQTHLEQTRDEVRSARERITDDAVCLYDSQTGESLAVFSAHLTGYHLGYEEDYASFLKQADGSDANKEQYVTHRKQSDLELIRQGAEQIDGALNTLDAADNYLLHVYAGDFNSFHGAEHGQRVERLEANGFTFASEPDAASILDINLKDKNGNPRPVNMDYTGVRGRKGIEKEQDVYVRVSTETVGDLYDPANASDHLPKLTKVQVGKAAPTPTSNGILNGIDFDGIRESKLQEYEKQNNSFLHKRDKDNLKAYIEDGKKLFTDDKDQTSVAVHIMVEAYKQRATFNFGGKEEIGRSNDPIAYLLAAETLLTALKQYQ